MLPRVVPKCVQVDDPGPLSYRDPKSVRRVWRIRANAIYAPATLALVLGLTVFLFRDGVSSGIPLAIWTSFVVMSAGASVIVFVSWTWTVPVAVHINGIYFPARVRKVDGRASFFVPFHEMVWAYANPSLPLIGIKVGLKSGRVQRIPFRILGDARPVLQALKSRVPMQQTDPEVEAVVHTLDEVPDFYAGLWDRRRGTDRAQLLVAGIVAAMSITTVFLVLPVFTLDPFQILLVWLVVVLAVLAATWMAERKMRADFLIASLWVPHAEQDLVLGILTRFLERPEETTPRREKKWALSRAWLFRLNTLGAELRVSHQPRTNYEPPYWNLRLRYSREREADANAFLGSLTRHAIEVGMIGATDWRIDELLARGAATKA